MGTNNTKRAELCSLDEKMRFGQVLRSLVGGPKTAAEVARYLGIEVGGRISLALASLEEAGIVRDDSGLNPETGEEMREHRYRLSDNYSRFYLKCIEPNKAAIDAGSYEFTGMNAFEEYDGIMGYQAVIPFRKILSV